MQFNEYKTLALRTESQPRLQRIQHATMGMSTEVGEIMDNLKKHMFYNKDLDIDNIKEELGDIMRYMAIMCDTLDFDLGEIMEANIRKLKVRYPDGFSDYDAEHRDTEKEMKEITKGDSVSPTPEGYKRYETISAGELRKMHGRNCRFETNTGVIVENAIISVDSYGWLGITHDNKDADGSRPDEMFGKQFGRCIYLGSDGDDVSDNIQYNRIEIESDD